MTPRELVAATLREEIERGVYGHAGRLPGEHQLADRFEVARATVGAALRGLEDEGVVESRPRFGWYARRAVRRDFPLHTIDARYAGKDVWQTWLAVNDLVGDSDTTVTLDIPPPHVREHLALPEGERVSIRHRRRWVRDAHSGEDETWAISVAYWPLFVAEGTDLMRTGTGDEVHLTNPSPLAIAAGKGYVAAHNRDVVTGRPAEPDEAEHLALPARGYVLTVCRTSTTAGGTPFRVTHDVLDNRRFRLIRED